MTLRTVTSVVESLPLRHHEVLPVPPFQLPSRPEVNVGLAVESMKRHMTDEGWQIFASLAHAGYRLTGAHLPESMTDVRQILHVLSPTTVVMQDKREWDTLPRDFRDKSARFTNVEALRDAHDVFKVTILKDSHQRPQYHSDSAAEIGCHAWIVYYHPDIVKRNAPYVRQEHVIRTYHTIDYNLVQPYKANGRDGCLLSGAVSNAYPLRKMLAGTYRALPKTTLMKHPGYHMNGCATPRFLQELTKYKVAICTSSVFGYALRKIIEATACGCVVVTDLPMDEVMPMIDENLVRVPSTISTMQMRELLPSIYDSYNPERQAVFAEAARWYDYRASGVRLASAIQAMRASYGTNQDGDSAVQLQDLQSDSDPCSGQS